VLEGGWGGGQRQPLQSLFPGENYGAHRERGGPRGGLEYNVT